MSIKQEKDKNNAEITLYKQGIENRNNRITQIDAEIRKIDAAAGKHEVTRKDKDGKEYKVMVNNELSTEAKEAKASLIKQKFALKDENTNAESEIKVREQKFDYEQVKDPIDRKILDSTQTKEDSLQKKTKYETELAEKYKSYQDLMKKEDHSDEEITKIQNLQKDIVNLQNNIQNEQAKIQTEEQELKKHYNEKTQSILKKIGEKKELSPEDVEFISSNFSSNDLKDYFKIKNEKIKSERELIKSTISFVNKNLMDIRNYKNFRSTSNNSKSSRSFFMSNNDFLWSENFADTITQSKELVQSIIISEYQPDFAYNMAKEAIGFGAATADLAVQAGSAGLEKFLKKKFKIPKAVTRTAENAVGSLLQAGSKAGGIAMGNSLLHKYSANPEELYSLGDDSFLDPLYNINKLFQKGYWLNTYQLPFLLDKEYVSNYLLSNQGSNWTYGGLLDGATQGNGSTSQFLNAIQSDGIGFALPTIPTFKMENVLKSRYKSIQIKFNLINKDDIWLSKNFEFLQAFFAGTQWLMMTGGVILGTNVYNILIPGRFQIKWASIDTNFECHGRLRQSSYMYETYGKELKSIQETTLWPDAWLIHLTINPLSMWNYNTYSEYIRKGMDLNLITQTNNKE